MVCLDEAVIQRGSESLSLVIQQRQPEEATHYFLVRSISLCPAVAVVVDIVADVVRCCSCYYNCALVLCLIHSLHTAQLDSEEALQDWLHDLNEAVQAVRARNQAAGSLTGGIFCFILFRALG